MLLKIMYFTFMMVIIAITVLMDAITFSYLFKIFVKEENKKYYDDDYDDYEDEKPTLSRMNIVSGPMFETRTTTIDLTTEYDQTDEPYEDDDVSDDEKYIDINENLITKAAASDAKEFLSKMENNRKQTHRRRVYAHRSMFSPEKWVKAVIYGIIIIIILMISLSGIATLNSKLIDSFNISLSSSESSTSVE